MMLRRDVALVMFRELKMMKCDVETNAENLRPVLAVENAGRCPSGPVELSRQ